MTGTFVELEGKFKFSINQSGLDFKNKKEREMAIKDFWDCFEKFQILVHRQELSYLSLEFNKKDLKVQEGE